ncbi:MAG: uracil-DNA glycosylase [Delftia acidovorans]|nr:uracil-DNA glycosylase [Delftia acidovorans]
MALQDDAIAPAQADQLQSADPADWPVAPDWQPLVEDFFAGATGQQLLTFLHQRLEAGAVIFPPQPLRALELTPPEEVRPPSLQNIFKEMQRDLGVPFPPFPNPGGSLVKWARNGVLLLNTCLTVEEGQAASHSGKGWELLTDAVIRHIAQGARPVVFMLWGSHAQSKRAFIPADRGHLVLTSNHPSPLSALRPPVPFIGNGHFGKARDFRAQHGY